MDKDIIKLVVISDRPEERNSVLKVLANVDYFKVIGEAAGGPEAVELLKKLEPDLLLIGAGADGAGYSLAGELTRRRPSKPVIIIERELNEDTVRKAVSTGARDVILYPFEPSRLVDSLYRSVQDASAIESDTVEEDDPGQEGAFRGSIFTFFSTKGGVGKTFCSVNLAIALALESGRKVALVDLDLEFGSAALAFNIYTLRSLVDLAEKIELLDPDLLDGYLIAHNSGVKVLPAGSVSAEQAKLTAQQLEVILKELAASFQYVVIDMPVRITGHLEPAVQLADLLFLVTTPEISSIRNIKLVRKMLLGAGYPRTKIRYILNRADSRTGIKSTDVENILKEGVYAVIPADYRRVPYSLNRGVPVVQSYPRAKVSKALRKVAVALMYGQ